METEVPEEPVEAVWGRAPDSDMCYPLMVPAQETIVTQMLALTGQSDGIGGRRGLLVGLITADCPEQWFSACGSRYLWEPHIKISCILDIYIQFITVAK